MFPKEPPEEHIRKNRRSGGQHNDDLYVNFITVGPITEDAQRITGMIISNDIMATFV